MISGDVEQILKALLFFGLGDMATNVQAKIDSFVDEVEHIIIPTPPVYPSHMLGNSAKELPRILRVVRLVATSSPLMDPSENLTEKDPRLSWLRWKNANFR